MGSEWQILTALTKVVCMLGWLLPRQIPERQKEAELGQICSSS